MWQGNFLEHSSSITQSVRMSVILAKLAFKYYKSSKINPIFMKISGSASLMIIYSFKTRPLPLRSNLSSEVKLKTLSFHNTRTLVDIYIFFLDPHPPFQTPAKVSIPRNHVISLHYF